MGRSRVSKKKTIAMLTQALHRAPTEEEIKKERSRCKKVFGTRAKALHRPRTEEELAVSKGKTIAKKKPVCGMYKGVR